MAPRPRIAVVQEKWTTDTEQNLSIMENSVRGIKSEWNDAIQLITFSEYAVTGFDPATVESATETIPGPATERLGKLARETGYYICNGSMLYRTEKGELRNASVILDPDGNIIHHYDKTHPWCAPVGGECVTPGSEFPVTDIPGLGRVGTMICYDGYFPEVARSLAYNGAEIILWNSMGFHPLRELSRAIAQTRALENSCYVVLGAGSGIHVGIGLHGNSMVVDPDGVVTSEVGETATILIDLIDVRNVAQTREEGTKGLLLPWTHLKTFGHAYPSAAGG